MADPSDAETRRWIPHRLITGIDEAQPEVYKPTMECSAMRGLVRPSATYDPKEIFALQDEINRSAEALYDHRLHAVLLVAKGMSSKQAAEALGEATNAVEAWVHQFKEIGFAALNDGALGGQRTKGGPDTIYPRTIRSAAKTSPGKNRAQTLFVVLVAMMVGLVTPARGDTGFESTKPAVRVEYWQKRLEEITSSLKQRQNLSSVKLVFLGDSITDFWTLGDNPWMPGKRGGLNVWNDAFTGKVPENLGLNLGISGDRTEHVLYRILPQSVGGLGELDSSELNPEFVILLIGINNSWAAESPVEQSVFAGIRAVVSAVHSRKPKATIILESLLPTNDEGRNSSVVGPVNKRLVDLSATRPYSDYVRYLDLHSAFVDPSGKQITDYFNDGLHPSESGYGVWRDCLVPFLERVRKAPAARP
jgi:lysophospholipase L1-like esterase